jgi:hypothetical protein
VTDAEAALPRHRVIDSGPWAVRNGHHYPCSVALGRVSWGTAGYLDGPYVPTVASAEFAMAGRVVL